ARPAAALNASGSTLRVVQVDGWRWGTAPWRIRNRVEPYCSMRLPGFLTPALTASAHASTVPATTGTPARSPVVEAAGGVTVPTTSEGHRSGGSGSPGTTESTHSSIQLHASSS